MSGILFTANRFAQKFSHDTKVQDKSVQNANSNTISNVAETRHPQPLLDNDYFRIINASKLLPKLSPEEAIISIKAATSKIATIITTNRILVYNYKSNDSNPYFFECSYDTNDYNLPPLCLVIPNPIHELKPDLIVVDPVSGGLTFHESIKMTPSLGVLQNIKKSRINLNNAEFLTDIVLFQESDLLLTTSQCRVLYIKLKDHLRDSILHYNEIYNNRSFVSFMLSKSYSIREYRNTNHIAALKLYDITPVEKLIVILESSGRFAFIKHFNGSTTFSLEGLLDINTMMNNLESTFLDFELSVTKQTGIVLLRENNNAPFSGVVIPLQNLKGTSIEYTKFNVPMLSRKRGSFTPKIFFAGKDEMCIIESYGEILLFAPEFSNLPATWSQLVALKNNVEIFSIEKANNNTIYLNSNKGIIFIEIKKSGLSNDQSLYLEQHIAQYLKFENPYSEIVYNLKDMGVPYDQNLLKAAIIKVSNDLMQNKGFAVGSNTGDNIKMRMDYYMKLIRFASENYEFGDDDDLRSELLTYVDIISMANGFYSLSFEEKYSEMIKNSLRALNYDEDISAFFEASTGDIVILIDGFVSIALELCVANELVKLADALGLFFFNSFVRIDYEMKRHITKSGLCKAFASRYALIKNINELTRKVADMNKDISDELLKKRSEEALLKLSYFLYYAASETALYLKKVKNQVLWSNYSSILNSDKSNWISIFIILSKQSEIIPLVLLYEDMSSLAALMESKREALEEHGKAIMDNIIGQSEVEMEFDHYFEVYGYSFAEALFKHYVSTNKINVMLSKFAKYTDFLERFLSSDLNYNKFGWIHDAQKHNFTYLSSNLLKYMKSHDYNSNNKLFTKKLHSSLGKLSALCAQKSTVMQKDDLFTKFNGILWLISIQNEIYDKLVELGIIGEEFDVEIGARTQSKVFTKEINSTFKKLKAKLPLTLIEIINFISLASFIPVSNSNFLTNGMEIDGVLTESSEEIGEDFITSLSARVFLLLKNYTQFNFVEDTPTLNEREKIRTMWIKLLIRRLVLRDDNTAALSKVVNILNHDAVEGYLHDSSCLKLKREELELLGIKDEETINEYLNENGILNSIEIFKST